MALPTQENTDTSEGRIYLHPDAFLAAQISAGELLAVSLFHCLSVALSVTFIAFCKGLTDIITDVAYENFPQPAGGREVSRMTQKAVRKLADRAR